MAGSVQFKGVEQVMQAFEGRNVDAWSVWQHKQFMFKGFGAADLRTLLENIASGATNAIYTIKVYEDITSEDDIKNIKEKKECDGSFNFRLNDERQEITGSMYGSFDRNKQLMDRLAAIEEKLDNPPAADDETETIQGAIGNAVVQIIKDPGVALQWVQVLSALGIGKPVQHQPGLLRQIPGSPAAVGTTAVISEEEKMTRLYQVFEILEKEDPKILQHLEKLSAIATNSPGKFKSLLLMLETF